MEKCEKYQCFLGRKKHLQVYPKTHCLFKEYPTKIVVQADLCLQWGHMSKIMLSHVKALMFVDVKHEAIDTDEL